MSEKYFQTSIYTKLMISSLKKLKTLTATGSTIVEDNTILKCDVYKTYLNEIFRIIIKTSNRQTNF